MVYLTLISRIRTEDILIKRYMLPPFVSTILGQHSYPLPNFKPNPPKIPNYLGLVNHTKYTSKPLPHKDHIQECNLYCGGEEVVDVDKWVHAQKCQSEWFSSVIDACIFVIYYFIFASLFYFLIGDVKVNFNSLFHLIH